MSSAQSNFAPGARVLMDAHNCYPYSGQWSDRISRALSSGVPLAIEQDVALYDDPVTGKSRVVVTHDPKTLNGQEPTLREYFFERIRPMVERALKDTDRSKWPLITLNLDFKSDSPELITAVRSILNDYSSWLTTTTRGAEITQRNPLRVGPVLALTGDSDTQQRIFYDELPVGAEVLVFGAVHVYGKDRMAPPEVLVPEAANNYRRWWNNPWAVVEDGGQSKAGEWTHRDRDRLKTLVEYAHRRDYWIRFYTLDGGPTAEFRQNGWFDGYNFGSLEAAAKRWKAAKKAGADFIASDHYEALAETLGR